MPEDGLILTRAFASAGTVGNVNGTFYCGIGLRESAGAVATIRIRENNASGKILDAVQFAANASVSYYYGDAPIYCDGPIYMELVAGAVEGTLRYR
jgi:2-methylaconitate cis-trans-isomerase PrpF